MVDYAKQELGWIMDEWRQELVKNFMSGTIDFWTDPHRKQQFGCFVVDLTAEKYKMKNGNELFMSMQTKNRMNSGLFTNTTPILDSLEYPMNFEAFVSVHYGSFPFWLIEHWLVLINDNFVLSLSTGLFKDHCYWMLESCKESSIQQDDWGQLAANGGSNAIGSIRKFELITWSEDSGQESGVDFNVCYSHQNEHSGGYA